MYETVTKVFSSRTGTIPFLHWSLLLSTRLLTLGQSDIEIWVPLTYHRHLTEGVLLGLQVMNLGK